MAEETAFHFETTTSEIQASPAFSKPEMQEGLEVMNALLRAVGIQPGAATVTLVSEFGKSVEDAK